MTATEALNSLIQTLQQIRRPQPTDKAAWDDDLILRLAVERLWITAGNCAEEYRRVNQIDPGVEPWAELAGYRNRPTPCPATSPAIGSGLTPPPTSNRSSTSYTAFAERRAVVTPAPGSAPRGRSSCTHGTGYWDGHR